MQSNFKKTTTTFNNLILETTSKDLSTKAAIKEFMNIGGWKARRSGRELNNVTAHLQETREKDKLVVDLLVEKSDWCEWIKTVGAIDRITAENFNIRFENHDYNVRVSSVSGITRFEIFVNGNTKTDLDNDLLNKYLGLKMNKEQKLITVHRYGAQSILNEQDLVLAVQESIKEALEANGVEYMGEASLKESVIKWLSNSANKAYFNAIIKDEFPTEFGGDDVDKIIEKLESYTQDKLLVIMNKIFKIARLKGIRAMTLDKEGMVKWIQDIINTNNLRAIVFIWDEFTKYFENNIQDLRKECQTLLSEAELEIESVLGSDSVTYDQYAKKINDLEKWSKYQELLIQLCRKCRNSDKR